MAWSQSLRRGFYGSIYGSIGTSIWGISFSVSRIPGPGNLGARTRNRNLFSGPQPKILFSNLG